MDINCFDTKTRADEGVEIELSDLKTGRPAGVFIKVIGSDGDRFSQLTTERARQLRDITSRGEASKADIDRLASQLLAGCTIGWRGLTRNGDEYPYSPAAALDLYTNYPAIREQIDVAIMRRANFVLA
jgi:hypothetical protein